MAKDFEFFQLKYLNLKDELKLVTYLM